MKNWMPLLMGFLLAGTGLWGADAPELNNAKARASYALGANVGRNLRQDHVTVDTALVLRGLEDVLQGKDLLLTEDEGRQAMQAYWNELRQEQAERNITEGSAYLAENKAKPGVITLPSGLQYEVLEAGQGRSPGSNDMVSVEYRGTLLDGTEFDSSYARNQPAKFQVNRVIPGWSEALQLMQPGARWRLVIPSNLAYGEKGAGGKIGPNAALIFEVKMLSVEAPPAPPKPAASTPQVVTSDIIKVPSKEEMEKGAKIEVIKKEDVEKLLQEKQTNAPPK